jgi:hypothetical protein
MGMASKLADLRRTSEAAAPDTSSKQVHKSTSLPQPEKPRYQRRTYHLRPDQIERIEAAAFHQRLDISEVVRQALDAWLDNGPVHK